MNNSDKPVVSFCIPVYNNAEAAVKIVQGLLVSDRQDFEVIVSDDASSDNAQELLAQIHDSRFKYYRNEKNLGAHGNWLHSLELGQGQWLYIIMGRDEMKGEHIGKLTAILEHDAKEVNAAFLNDKGNKDKIYVYNGIEAMINFVDYNHPTGNIFRADVLKAIPNRKHYFETADMYPEAFLIRDMLIKGSGMLIRSGVNTGGLAIDKSKIKSTVEHDIDIFKTYFAPARRLKQFYELIDMIELDLPGMFTQSEINKYFRSKFNSMLKNVSYIWYGWCCNPVQMAHYGQEVRKVSTKEMLNNIINAYRETKEHLKEKGIYTSSKNRIMIECAVFASIYWPIRKFAREILAPLKIWDVLIYLRKLFTKRSLQ